MGVVAAAVGVGTALIGASASRSAASSAADSSAAAVAAQAQTAKERLAFDSQVYADGAADRAWASQNAREVAAAQAEDRKKYNALQDEQVARGRIYQAEEDKMLDASKTYDNEGRRAMEVQKAQADVNSGFTSANEQMLRDQGRRGINLSGAASAEIQRKNRLSQALGLAGAAATATKNVETQGYARKMDALGLGKGLIGNQATQAGLQLGAGNASVTNGQVPITIRQEAGKIMSNGYGNAGAAYSNLAGAYNTQYNNAMESGANVGNMFGSIFNKPGVTSGITNSINKWMTPSNADTVIPMQVGGGY